MPRRRNALAREHNLSIPQNWSLNHESYQASHYHFRRRPRRLRVDWRRDRGTESEASQQQRKTATRRENQKNGKHQIDKKGDNTVSVDVKDGKIAALHVKHAKKGDLPVKKYKTSNKMAQAYGFQRASLQLAQAQSLGTVYIGYAYYDEYGDEVIYWFPYEMIYDGDTGAVEYIPIY